MHRASRCATGFNDEDLIRSQRSAEIGSARELADAWKQAVLDKGGFMETAAHQNHPETLPHCC
jgi:hypothetical protein